MVGDHHHRWGVRIHGQFPQVANQILTATQVQTRAGFIQQQQLWVGHQRTGNKYALLLPLAERSPHAILQVRSTYLLQYSVCMAEIHVIVFLAPPPKNGVACGNHQVTDLLFRRDAVSQSGG